MSPAVGDTVTVELDIEAFLEQTQDVLEGSDTQ